MKTIQRLAMSMAGLAGVTLLAGCCCCCHAPEPPSNGVQIKVYVGGLSDEEIEELKGKLAAIAGSESNNSTTFNGAATWNYTTDEEPQAFADKIDFATVKSVEDRVITLHVSRVSADDETDDGADITDEESIGGDSDDN